MPMNEDKSLSVNVTMHTATVLVPVYQQLGQLTEALFVYAVSMKFLNLGDGCSCLGALRTHTK